MKVADAVGFAHARGVIHRDLKPENVMLGDFGEVLVMDWGLALPAAGFAKAATISPAHSMGGTPAYMAPEMASGPLEKINFTSDVYLLGAILYEILTGRPPHTGKNTMQCLFAAAKNDIRQTDKTGELMDIALRAMATKTKARYETVRHFQDAIRDYQSHTESSALSTRAAEEMQKAQASDDYRDYARALFAFEESLALWNGNARARTGLDEIKLKYAASALRKGDFDLGAGLLDPANPDHARLHRQLNHAQLERETRQNRLQTLKRVAASLAALFLVSLTVGFFWIKSARDKAIESQRLEAVARATADEQTIIALAAKEEAGTQRDEAVDARREEAVARAAADEQTIIALAAKEEAGTQRDNAIASEKAAIEARKREEYEAYIARIGLAAAKIEDNAFDNARELLNLCHKETPELLNWEWGRLMFLCGQSRRAVDARARLDAAAFAPDGKRFVTGSLSHTADVWDTATGEKQLSIPHAGAQVHAVAYSPVAPLIATGSNDPQGYLRIVNAQTGEIVRRFPEGDHDADRPGHRGEVFSVAFSRDGRRLLSTSYDKTARLWDVETGRELQAYAGHNWWVWQAAFSPDDSQFVTVSHDGTAIVWDVESGEQKGQFIGHKGPVFSVAWSGDGRVATGGYDTKILVWKPADLKPFDLKKIAEGEPIEQPPLVTLEGHSAGVHSVRFSRDSELVLSGAHDNSVRLWDASSGHQVQTFRGHASWVRACALSPDERTILSVGYDQKALLWNITEYEEVRVLKARTLKGHSDAVLAASFSHDGQQIVTASRDKTARTWNFSDGSPLQTFEEGHTFLASNAAFFSDGTRLATAAVDNTVRIWDVATGSEIDRFDHTGRSAALAMSRDARRMLTGSDDKSAKVWDIDSRTVVATFRGHKQEVTAVAFAPDDKVVFTGDSNGASMLWEPQSGELLQRLDGHTRKVTGAAFLPNGRRLLTASIDKTVAQWDLTSGQELVKLVLRHPDAVLALALLPDGRRALTSCADGQVRLWDLDSASVALTLASKGVVNAVAVTDDGKLALTASSEEKTVRLWNLPSGREREVPAEANRLEAFLNFNRRGGQVWTAIFAPKVNDKDKVLTVGGSDARLWDLDSGDEIINFSPNGIVASAVFSTDGKHVLTGSWDNSARIWTAENGHSERKLIDQHSKGVNTAVFSPDGTMILTASDDQTAVLWEPDAQEWKVLKVLKGHKGSVRSGVFSPDGRQVLTASSDKTARLWDVDSGAELRQFVGHDLAVLSAVFSADGSRIATGSEDRSARVWEINGDEKPLVLEGHTAPVSSVTFLHDRRAPQGSRLITGSLDNTAKLWDVDRRNGEGTGKEILTLKGHTQEVTCVDASTSGLYLLTGGRDGKAVVWLAIDWTKPLQVQAAK
ncbi:MAG: serine/threonine protein kinase [Planctomycetaceae bacterium]|nr:serine/threonine protein kinase [Planctomycetaceae bacterium]